MPTAPVSKPRFASGDRVAIDVPDGLKTFHEYTTRRDYGYVVRPWGVWAGVPCYNVYLPHWNSVFNAAEGRLVRVPTGPLPVLLCKLPGGRTAAMNYLDHRPVCLSADDPPLPRNWTPADRAGWEGLVLARYYARRYPDPPREYWVGHPVGTCFVWTRIDPTVPNDPAWQGGYRAAVPAFAPRVAVPGD